ncbi:MAG: AsmA family protein, partial [Alphaproteobacteria bacterium]|nr:AsmA family protein [Alphaproteobacteria bacterium]
NPLTDESFDNEKVFFTKLKSDIDSDPISINGEITSLRTNPQLNIHLSAPLTQNFADKYINKFMIYPLLIKGDIDYRAHITGTLDSINLKANANLKKGASLYYKGAILDAQKAPLKADLDLNISKSGFLIRKFQYVQDNSSTILRAFGKIKFHGQTPIFENFKITTFSPADARIFNIIFKKPIIKKGSFTSNVTINGSAFSPSIFGKFNINGVNIPFLDVDINDIDLTFNNHRTDLKLKGEVFSNIITANANIENNFKAPYTINNASVYLGNFNVNTFLTHLDKLTLENVDKVETENNINFNLKDLIIKELNVKAKSVHVRNLSANDMDATLTLNNGLFDLKKATATVAGGSISSKIKYDFKTSIMSISLAMDKINANTISEALFDIKNQFYGNLNGQATLSCNGKTHESCMKTLKGDCSFSVLNGRMPKLGSLEYLLKSSNVLKSGITGLSINNILELLSPLKTGDFESIKGSFTVANGTTKDLKIASKGKDLSIYILGKYNFYDAIADLEIYGRLAKRISNGLGFVGNLSLNTLFNSIPGVNLSKTNQAEFVKLINKIPGIELNTNEFRIFFVKL